MSAPWGQGVFLLIAASLAGLPQRLSGKECTCNAGDPGSILGSERSPGEVNGYPLQYCCLENPMDRGAWWAKVLGVEKSWTWLSNKHLHLQPLAIGLEKTGAWGNERLRKNNSRNLRNVSAGVALNKCKHWALGKVCVLSGKVTPTLNLGVAGSAPRLFQSMHCVLWTSA